MIFLIATARYTSVAVSPGEVNVATPNGVLKWAGANLSGVGTFASSVYDYGCLFQWGYNYGSNGTAVITGNTGSTSNTVGNTRTANYSGSTWNSGQGPCPTGWRLPTRQEFADLIGYTGSDRGVGTTPNTYTTWTWTTGTSGKITTKAVNGVDAGRELYFPTAGFRTPGGLSQYPSEQSRYWSSTAHSNGTGAYNLAFHDAGGVGAQSWYNEKNIACSVRCVR